MRNFLLAACVLAGCGFSKELPPDAPGPDITIGFVEGTSMADEKSMAHQIKVRISDVSPVDVTVKYQIEGGTASPPADFDIVTPETMTIPAGELETSLEVKVKADVDGNEDDETIQFVLVEPKHAQIAFGTEKHQVTIRARALPRVKFAIAQSSAQEPMDATIFAELDEVSEFEITADFAVASTTATSGLDYNLANGSVVFPANTLTVPITLDVLDDVLDEDNESILLTLTSATNAIVDTTAAEHTYTILDDAVDPPPTVQFSAATSTHGEAAGTVNLAVTLSAVSGRTITVPFVVDTANSTATGGGTDFSIGTSITIAPGAPGGAIAVTIVDDLIDEPSETAEIDLQTATNATITGQVSHRLQIDDNDLVCYGSNATVDVCFETAPAGGVTLSGAIDTDGAMCAPTQPVNWTATQDPACVIAGATITVNGGTTVTGSRPLVLVAATTMTINASIDASSEEGGASNGPGTAPNTCAGTAPQNNNGGAGGGAGGSFSSLGGAGGTGNVAAADGGTPAAMIAAAPARLRPGCAGQNGGNAMSSQGGAGGAGGGALYLVAGTNMTITDGVAIHASGAGASASSTKAGGGGGGSGGMIRLFAGGTLSAGDNTKIVANGGGGSGGGSAAAGGAPGFNPVPQTETVQAGGGGGDGADAGDGGLGFAGTNVATVGTDSAATDSAGGGGGGGGGFVVSNKTIGSADTSPAAIIIP